MHSATFYIGTSNITLPGAKKTFPEAYRAGTRLQYYSSLFNSLEVNSTFYKVPQESTLAKWATEVPDDFRFTIKLWREITHRKKLAFEREDIAMFLEVANGIGKKKGCLLVQFPASIKTDSFGGVAEMLAEIQRFNTAPRWRVCVEFRDAGWYENEAVAPLLRKLQISNVVHDMPGSIPPAALDRGKPVYLRFHGEEGDYRGSYPEEFLAARNQYIQELLANGTDVYAYFNNTMGEAFHNAQRLMQGLGVRA